MSLGGRNSSELASDYEEFFLNNADDIADLLKKFPKASTTPTCTHFQAQQMVCSMVQVSSVYNNHFTVHEAASLMMHCEGLSGVPVSLALSLFASS